MPIVATLFEFVSHPLLSLPQLRKVVQITAVKVIPKLFCNFCTQILGKTGGRPAEELN
jgi:hypothetical protein